MDEAQHVGTCGRIYLDEATGETARCGKPAGHPRPLEHGPDEDAPRMIKGKPTQLTDGYHTMEELYDHRRALSAVLAGMATRVGGSWRSKRHHPEDSPMFEGGYFVVGVDLPEVGTITYHYKLKHWDKFNGVDELAHAPRWDGAPPAVTVDRLLEWASRARR